MCQFYSLEKLWEYVIMHESMLLMVTKDLGIGSQWSSCQNFSKHVFQHGNKYWKIFSNLVNNHEVIVNFQRNFKENCTSYNVLQHVSKDSLELPRYIYISQFNIYYFISYLF